MKPAFLYPLLLIAGLGVGGGAAFGVGLIAGGESAPAKPVLPATEFVPTGPVLVPLVFADGRLAGYVSIETQLEVPAEQVEQVRARMPMLLHAINLQTYRTPLASGPDGQLANLAGYRKIVAEAAPKAFGAGIVRRAAIVQARPS